MFSKLMKLTFVGCIVIAASVPAEAGLFDRIRNRNGGRKLGCCQPQVVCAPAPCAPAPCACAPCAPAPCAPAACVSAPSCPCSTPPSCLQQYRHNLELCDKFFGNDPQKCRECRKMAELAYCECLKDPTATFRAAAAATMAAPACTQPGTPTIDACYEFYEMCIARGTSPSCAMCYFKCLEQIPSVAPPIPTY